MEYLVIWCTWLLLVNLGMIWCFGFFFLEILDDWDEESQQQCDALASLDDVDRNWAAFRQMLRLPYHSTTFVLPPLISHKKYSNLFYSNLIASPAFVIIREVLNRESHIRKLWRQVQRYHVSHLTHSFLTMVAKLKQIPVPVSGGENVKIFKDCRPPVWLFVLSFWTTMGHISKVNTYFYFGKRRRKETYVFLLSSKIPLSIHAD